MVCKIRDVIPKTGNLAFPLWRCWTKPRLSSGPHQAPETSRGPDWYLNASNCSLFLGDKSTIWIPEHRRVSFQQYFILILTTFNLPGTVKVLNQTKTQFLKLFISFPTWFTDVDQFPLVPLKGSPLLHPSRISNDGIPSWKKIVTNGLDISISEQ